MANHETFESIGTSTPTDTPAERLFVAMAATISDLPETFVILRITAASDAPVSESNMRLPYISEPNL